MASAVNDNPRLKFVTSFKDRHNKRRFYFRYRGQKFKLPGKLGSSEFMATYAQYLAGIESGALGRESLGFLKGSIGWVIEKFLASDVGFRKLRPGSQRNYRRWLDTIKQRSDNFRLTI